MRRALSLMLALVLCLGLWACGLNADEMTEILCYGEWVSEDNIDDTIGLGYEQTYPAIRFFIDGYCEVDLALYKDGQLTGSDTNTYTWKIEDGKVALVPVNADSDILYYEYEDGILVGSARYRDRFTYTHVDSEHRLEDTYDTFSDARLYKEAQALLAEGNWEEAYALFAALGDYQDAEEYVSGFYHRVKELHYDSYSISSISKWNYEYFVYYTYDEKGNLICEETVVPERPDAVTPHTWEYAYDENGIMTQATVTNYADSTGKQITSSTTYEYDPNGLILSWSSVKYSNGAEIPDASDYENTFFDNGCLSYQKSTTVNENSTTIIEHFYDEAGNQVRYLQTVTKDSQTNVYDYHYTYDENGRMLTSVQTYGGKTYEYTYGQEGQILTGTCTDENGRVEDVALNYTLSYDYDQDGNLLEQVKRYDAGRIETVNYVYDDAGNLIRETEWTNNLRLHEIEYTYELSYQPAA